VRFIHLRYLFIFCLVFRGEYVAAQIEADTSDIYIRLENRSNKYKFTRWIHSAIFKKPDNNQNENIAIRISKRTTNPFLKYKGKVVRNISIVVLDPFGYNVNDFYGKRPDYLEGIANKYHVTSKERIIKNILLFQQDEQVDPLALSESERLLRLSPYLLDARIYVQKFKGVKSDSVDVTVVVQDNWSILVGSKFDLGAPDISFIDKNFLGIGHQIEEDVTWNTSDQYIATTGKYSILNIKNTFISTAAFYSTTKENKQFGVTLDRPFYSPLAIWAGGISLIKNNTISSYTVPETGVINKYPLTYNTYDLWAAKSFPLTQQISAPIEKRSSSFIVGARYYHIDFFDRPSFAIDSNRVNRDQSLYLANFGFTKRKYYRDRYLFRYGANEDIPEGISAELVVGLMKKEFDPLEYYSGIKFAAGKHFEDIGYLSIGTAYGTFYNPNQVNSGVVNVDAFYFTDLVKYDRWYYRQFLRFNFVEGIDREVYENVQINGNQMNGFSSASLAAKSKMILNFEFVLYAPYKVLGFQFAPVLVCGFAGMGNNFGSMFKSPVYQGYALGVLIRNEYLVASTFQISIGLYPYMPGNSDYSLKLNPVSSYDVRARDYFISKADLVPYQ